jgi:uncharacterized protein YtpQ (UPF0354 family)
MRTISNDESQTATQPKKTKPMPKLQTFTATLSDGREITIREMTGRDLVYLEKDLAKEGDVAKGMKIIERLIVGDDKVTYDEILDMGVRDFRKLSELVAKANGDDEDPN